MYTQNRVLEKASVFPKISIEYLKNFVLKHGNENSRLFANRVSFVVGGAVYKKIVGDETHDLDVVTNDVKGLGDKLIKAHHGSYHPSDEDGYFTDVTKVVISGTKLSVDVITIEDMIESINKSGLNMTNALLICPDNTIKHIMEIPIIEDKLNLQTIDAKKEREWVLSKITEKKFCNTAGLRGKDVKYFRENGWKEIDAFECKNHGMSLYL